MKTASCLLAFLLLSPLPALAQSAGVPDEVFQCMQQNVPQPDTVRAVRIASRDRVGNRTVVLARIWGHRAPDGMREMLITFAEPEDMRGTAFLLLQRETDNEAYFRSGELPEPKRLGGPSSGMPLFGSDFSYEDFEYLVGLNERARSKQLPDAKVGPTEAYVIETRPEASEGSAYRRILSFVDKKTCVMVRMETYQAGDRVRKIFEVNPDLILKRGDVWVPNLVSVRDLKTFSDTQIFIDSVDDAPDLPREIFTVEGLKRGVLPE